jgi:hypothetical protein
MTFLVNGLCDERALRYRARIVTEARFELELLAALLFDRYVKEEETFETVLPSASDMT